MKVRAHYRPRPGELYLRLRCKCVVQVLHRRGRTPREWFCKNHEALADRKSNYSVHLPVFYTPTFEATVPVPRRRVSMKALVEILGGKDVEKALEAGRRIGERLRRKKTSQSVGGVE